MVLDDRVLCRADIQSRYETHTQRTGCLEFIPVFHAQEYILEISSVYPKVSLSSTLSFVDVGILKTPLTRHPTHSLIWFLLASNSLDLILDITLEMWGAVVGKSPITPSSPRAPTDNTINQASFLLTLFNKSSPP